MAGILGTTLNLELVALNKAAGSAKLLRIMYLEESSAAVQI